MSEQPVWTVTNYKQGLYIIVEGKKADAFYIVQQGKVRITREAEGEEGQEEILGLGDFFGVVSSMSGHSHIETAQALTDVTLITVNQQQYAGLIQKSPQIAVKIITQFSKRLRELNKTLVQNTVVQHFFTHWCCARTLRDFHIHHLSQKAPPRLKVIARRGFRFHHLRVGENRCNRIQYSSESERLRKPLTILKELIFVSCEFCDKYSPISAATASGDFLAALT